MDKHRIALKFREAEFARPRPLADEVLKTPGNERLKHALPTPVQGGYPNSSVATYNCRLPRSPGQIP